MKKSIFLMVIFFFLINIFLMAHPASKVELAFNEKDRLLEVKYFHSVGDLISILLMTSR